ncbi:MAG: MBL fold metallo-hydrolase [Candidatus Micrarchaeia archaeon]
MKIKLLGGAQEVGRSGLLVKDSKTFLFDYGIKLDHKTEYPLQTGRIDAFLLSHAHLDHSGMAPALYNSMLPNSFGTAPTLELSKLLLNDAMKIARRERRQEKYHRRQLHNFEKHYTSVEYASEIEYGDFLIEFHDAGHISGSAGILLERLDAKENKRILYTGDFKLQPQTLHSGAKIVKSDILAIESTYAYKDHPDRKELIREFIKKVKEILENGGNVLLPVFAVGRGQEILSVLYENGLAESVYVDGMVREATRIVASYPDFIKDAHLLRKAVESATVIGDRSDRDIALSEPSIILTTAGMLSGGPVLDYITKLNSNSEILLTGYQIEGTNGSTLLKNGFITIDGKRSRISNRVTLYDFSAHAGMTDLYKYVRESAPNIVICMHGSEENTKLFAENLRGEGFEAYAPKIGEEIDLA